MTTESLTQTRLPALTRPLAASGRVVLGLIFAVGGLDGLLHFLPTPATPPPAGALAFGIAMMKTGYLWNLLKGTELLAGALLLANRFVPLALVVLAPIVVNIVAFHAFLAPSGIAVALVVLALEIALAWVYRDAYRSVLEPTTRVAP